MLQHHAIGPCLVKFGVADSEAELGYTADGVNIAVNIKTVDVPSDDFGGAAGGPSDVQAVGFEATVTCDFTKHDKAQIDAALSGVGGTAGVAPELGAFMRQDNKTGQLFLDGVAADYKFPVSYVTNAGFNNATKYTTYRVQFRCLMADAATRRLLEIIDAP